MSESGVFYFATCERRRALEFLQILYPNAKNPITDEGVTKALLDLVEKDILRIPDPAMHGMRVAIMPSKNYVETPENRAACTKACLDFHEYAIEGI